MPQVVVSPLRRSPIGALPAVVLLGLAACEGGQIAGPGPEPGNVEVQLDAQMVVSDSGVVVNGRPIVSYPSNGQALWVDRFDHYRHGGFPELGFPQSVRHSLSWRVMLTHANPPVQRGDSTIFSFIDHGQVRIAGEPVTRLTDLPFVSPGVPVRHENFIRYFTEAYVRIDWLQHGQITSVQAPYFDRLVSGAELLVETTGSAEVEPTAGTFFVRPFAELVRVTNGSDVPLNGSMPVIDVKESLVLTFDRPLDPAHSFIVLFPFPGVEGRRAFLQLQAPAQRVVIPASLLRDVVPGSASERAAYQMVVVEVDARHDVLTGHFADGVRTFSLPFVQRSETAMYLSLVR